jgi:hypothetical protein
MIHDNVNANNLSQGASCSGFRSSLRCRVVPYSGESGTSFGVPDSKLHCNEVNYRIEDDDATFSGGQEFRKKMPFILQVYR